MGQNRLTSTRFTQELAPEILCPIISCYLFPSQSEDHTLGRDADLIDGGLVSECRLDLFSSFRQGIPQPYTDAGQICGNVLCGYGRGGALHGPETAPEHSHTPLHGMRDSRSDPRSARCARFAQK